MRHRFPEKLPGSLPVNMTMLRALVELSETGSFSKAAERLCLTQSAISHAVRALEEAAGVALVCRLGRAIAMTDAGERAVILARSALDNVRQIAGLSEAPVKGNVTLALITSASIKLAPPLLERIAVRYPQLKVSLLMGTDQEVACWVREGIADMGLTFYPDGGDGTPILISDFLAISAEKSGIATGSVSLADLANRPFIMSSGGCAPIIEGLFEQAAIEPDIALTANDTTALFALVAAGHGVSIVPALSLPSKADCNVRRHALEPQISRPLWLLEGSGAGENRAVIAVKTTLGAVTEEVVSSRGIPGIYLE